MQTLTLNPNLRLSTGLNPVCTQTLNPHARNPKPSCTQTLNPHARKFAPEHWVKSCLRRRVTPAPPLPPWRESTDPFNRQAERMCLGDTRQGEQAHLPQCGAVPISAGFGGLTFRSVKRDWEPTPPMPSGTAADAASVLVRFAGRSVGCSPVSVFSSSVAKRSISGASAISGSSLFATSLTAFDL